MIVLTLQGAADRLAAGIRAADRRADRLELRLDHVRREEVAGLAREARSAGRTWIAACRRPEDGGTWEGSEEERVRLLREAARRGAARIDLEAGTPAAGLRRELPAERIVLSRHEPAFSSGAARRLDELRSLAPPPAWIKFVPTLSRATELLELRDLLRGAAEGTVLFAMGGPGLASRALALAWGSAATYASPDGEEPAAPGQPTLSRLVEEWRVQDLSADTPLTAVAGRPLGHTISPALHNASHLALARPERMLPLEAADVEDLLDAAGGLGVRGLAVTLPFKREMAARCAALGAEARACGAVNTAIAAHGGWRGESTDGAGFLDSLSGLPLPGRFRAAVLGAGGAASAVAAALRGRGCEVHLHARNEGDAQDLARRLGLHARPWAGAASGSADLLVNATPVGLAGSGESPLEGGSLAGYRAVVDLVYRVGETRLVREAREAGLPARDGRGMLVAQAERQFALLHGEPPPPGVMANAAEKALRRPAGRVAPGAAEG